MDAKHCEEIKTFLSEGSYPDNADKSSKRNLRRYSQSFAIIDGKVIYG